MLEKLLSPRGFKIYLAFFLFMFAYVMWHRFADTGIAAWMDEIQAVYLFSGSYYPKLTILLLLIPVAGVCFGIGYLHDWIFKLGIFAPDHHRDTTRL